MTDIDFIQAHLSGLDPKPIATLIERLEHAEAGSTELDAAICVALGGRKSGHLWQSPLEMAWTGAPPPVSTSINHALELFVRFFPDTPAIRHSVVMWTGRRPSARVLYQQQDDAAEGGWAFGALNPLAVHAATEPLAVILAMLAALRDRQAGISGDGAVSTIAETTQNSELGAQ